MAKPRRRRALVIVPVVFLLLIVLPALIGYLTDWFWFQEIGYERVFLTQLATRAALFLIGGAVAFAVLRFNLRMARLSGAGTPVLWRVSPELPPVDIAASLGKITLPLTFIFAFFFAVAAASSWMDLLQLINRSSFGVADPLFGRDVGTYVFVLPAVASLLGMLRGLIIISLIGALAIYVLRGKVVLPPQRVSLLPPADRHVAFLLVAFLLLTALQIWFVRLPELLYSTTGPLVGASYTDLNARYPAMHLVAATAVIGAGLVIFGMLRRRIVWFTAIAAVAYVAVSIIAGGLYPWAVQRFVVEPTELTRETPQLRHHIQFTRRAWALDKVQTRDLSGDAGLSLEDIRANGPTIQNVRLWDREPLLDTFAQLQAIRTYYDFVSVDDDRYMVDGRYRQVMLSARELNSESLPTRTFINQHLTFTHGMGLTLAPVNEVTAEGLPVLFIKDLPPASNVSVTVTRPAIYFGELTSSHIFVHTRQPEFDFPSGEENIFTRYTGTGGVRVGSVLKRALWAFRFGSLNILLSGDISSDSRLLFNRNVMARARLALPFLTFDNDAYMVIDEKGELHWILDAYTTTNRYPYSQRLTDGTNYMRNSVKVVVDAYNGSVTAYVVDPADPLIRTYSLIFPGIMRPFSDLPADLRAHIRYPRDLFRLQTAVYATFHMDEPSTFYHREDEWRIPTVGDRAEDDADRFMRHLIMRLPDERQAEYIYMAPFTPRGKDNLASWMIARNDGENYGTLRVYRFPKQSLVYGPRQIVARINQDTDIARELTLWDQRGSQVIRGELLVIPIEEALLYVQPIYLRGQGGRIPELKRVVVAFQNQVVMSETLESGLVRLFGAGAGGEPAAAPAPVAGTDTALRAPVVQVPQVGAPPVVSSALLRQAQEHYQRAMSAQRAGDWTTYGQEIQSLGEVLRRLNAGSR